jgi:hypothetical protein
MHHRKHVSRDHYPASLVARWWDLQKTQLPLLLCVGRCLKSCCLAMRWPNPLQYITYSILFTDLYLHSHISASSLPMSFSCRKQPHFSTELWSQHLQIPHLHKFTEHNPHKCGRFIVFVNEEKCVRNKIFNSNGVPYTTTEYHVSINLF